MACLFLFCLFQSSYAQQWTFDSKTLQAYKLTLNLQTEEALQLIPHPQTPQEHYVTSLAHTFELLITEDGEKFTEYESMYQKRLDRKIKTASPEEFFLQAETHLHWMFVYLKFGHEFDAAINLRQAYYVVKD